MSTDRHRESVKLSALLQGLSGHHLSVVQSEHADASTRLTRSVLTAHSLLLPQWEQPVTAASFAPLLAPLPAPLPASLSTLFTATPPATASQPDDQACGQTEQMLVLHASVAHAAAHLLFSPPALDVKGLKPMGIAVVSMIEDARVERLLMQRYPGTRRWFTGAMQVQRALPSTEFARLLVRLARGLLDEQFGDDDYWVSKARSLFLTNTQQHGLQDYAGFRALASVLANDLGQMRMQFNAQQYLVPVAYRDDNSYLWNFGTDTASEDLSVQAPEIAARQQTSTALSADRTALIRPSQARHLYHEWDARIACLRKDWCTVIDYAAHPVTCFSGSARSKISRRVPRIPNLDARALGRERLFRQREGDALDMSAAIESIVDKRRGAHTDGRHFMRRRLRSSQRSVLLLLDLSASVAECISGSVLSILDIEKQAAIQIADMALEMGDRIAIHGFSSDTRAGVHYYHFLDFGQGLTQEVLEQLERVEGKYSTRMGAAIRHARSFFKDETTDQQVLIVMTDGAPADIDVFDPSYLVSDTARAVKETNQAEVYGLVMDAGASDYAKQIFGVSRYRMILHAEKLTHHLVSVYSQLRSRAH